MKDNSIPEYDFSRFYFIMLAQPVKYHMKCAVNLEKDKDDENGYRESQNTGFIRRRQVKAVLKNKYKKVYCGKKQLQEDNAHKKTRDALPKNHRRRNGFRTVCIGQNILLSSLS